MASLTDAPIPLGESGRLGALKVVHWSLTNGSGMHRVAESLVAAERALGLDSVLADPTDAATFTAHPDAAIHVCHTHIPTAALTKTAKVVWVGHGTPDHVFQAAQMEFEQGNYGHGDPIMLMQHWLKVADARVTFWDRHAWIYDTMLTKGARKTDVIPMGVDTAFWVDGGVTIGKFAGEPSFFTAENPHYIKWPYDLLTAWPAVLEALPEAKVHVGYLTRDMHRSFFPWINANGASFGAYIAPGVFDKAWLKNAFRSTDFFVGLVRYGDLNHLSMQANAAGATTISYAGNPYADYWIPEGDQRVIAAELVAIAKGEREKRQKRVVADISETARAMQTIYGEIL